MSQGIRKVLITGATGNMGTMLSSALADDYDLVLMGFTPEEVADDDDREYVFANIANYDEITPHMVGIDCVIHLAGAASPESTWDAVLAANIIGFRNTLEAARANGVRRFVFASSNHVMGMYDRYEQWPVYPNMPTRPDSLYGVSKDFGEALGRFYHEEYNMEFIALRIGWNGAHPDSKNLDLLRAMWLGNEDAAEGFRCAIESDSNFGCYYLISDNQNRRWSTTNTLLELGYRPRQSWTDLSDAKENTNERTPDSWPIGS